MTLGVPRETYPGERRVALIPELIPQFAKLGFKVQIESGAGRQAGYSDDAYTAKGASITNSRDELFKVCDVVLQVRGYGSNAEAGREDLSRIKPGGILIGHYDPLSSAVEIKELAGTKAISFAIELLPRITRAQSMDALSSMATIAGYKAVLLAADQLSMMFPMLMTAAGTIAPARTFVIGAGVAGLQAIATAKRLGSVVHAYDVRPAVREQVESLGAKFVEMELDAADAEDKGGYARELGEDFYRRQRELMTRVVKETNVVITTAAIPGKKAPVLITEEMVKVMPAGSVIVDLAAERGGNCELTEAGKTIEKHDTIIVGPLNIPSTIPLHASQMYAKNLLAFVRNLVKDGAIDLNMEDEIIRDTLLTRDGEVVNARVKELLGVSDATPERSDG
ncbi:Re/Si-specific NAD(P)(+) transhydrogenase subunit alpha [bacterium]|nr:Re/Si-specific NAD(P)(+) transhydrogenase subunit alpha [bacterium]